MNLCFSAQTLFCEISLDAYCLLLKLIFLFFLSLFRHFNLRLKRDTKLFSPDLVIEVSGQEEPIDTSHIYSGEIFGKAALSSHHFLFTVSSLSVCLF